MSEKDMVTFAYKDEDGTLTVGRGDWNNPKSEAHDASIAWVTTTKQHSEIMAGLGQRQPADGERLRFADLNAVANEVLERTVEGPETAVTSGEEKTHGIRAALGRLLSGRNSTK